MFASVLLSLFIFVFSTLAAPQSTPSSACTIVQSGNLSPNGVSGNFGLFRGVLAFDPTNLATGFNVALQACSPTPSGDLLAPTGECLTVTNTTTTQGPTVVAMDCSAAASAQSAATWTSSGGFVFWSTPASSACSTGLYGYKAVSSSGTPAAVQKAPVSLGCSSDSTVFGFSVL